jgi:hypothetical protein
MPVEDPSGANATYTLGQLIRALEGSDNAYQANLRTAQRKETESPAEAVWWHVQASALKFVPDPARMPGIDRLEALCDEEWGSGLTAENVRKLRGRLCSRQAIGTAEVDAMTLHSVVDAFLLRSRGQENQEGQSSPRPKPAAAPDGNPAPSGPGQAKQTPADLPLPDLTDAIAFPEYLTTPPPWGSSAVYSLPDGRFILAKSDQSTHQLLWHEIPREEAEQWARQHGHKEYQPETFGRVFGSPRIVPSPVPRPPMTLAQGRPMQPVEVFLSYSHKDERLRDKLATHLSQLKHEGLITDWHDRKIGAGTEWAGQIDEHLNAARIILLLVSADFLASRYCYDVEMKRALARHGAGEARVIPVVLKPCDWHTAPFGKLKALPKDGLPVTKWKNRDEAFTDVARGIRAAVEELSARP